MSGSGEANVSGTLVGPVARVVGVALNAAIDKTASVDRLVPGDIHRPVVRSAVPGGKAANVVRAARHLGLAGEVVAVLGGHAGRWYADALAGLAIPLHAVEVDGETRTCLSVLDDSTGRLTELYEPGVRLTEADWPRVEDALAAAIGPGASDVVVVLAGSLPPGAPSDANRRLVTLAAKVGARAVVDAHGPALNESLGARPWLVKVNAAEAATATGGDVTSLDDAVAAAHALRSLGAANAVVTRGPDGAVLATGSGTWALAPAPTREQGPWTVGSGDAFLAGLLAGLGRDGDEATALRLAGSAGTANARVPGQGELDPADVDRLAGTLTVARVEGR